ncbi:peptide ABC transporter permease [Actinorhabdospora filicis]|uniref:Peptide ABC transporter permease n=1 Tax=Actinorhabdospora filicis TaxID=1785913 RepID=A0A9W6SRU0_9ACTN|nr:ABC transporter permease [Actinorhabdospora filicis]GLZ81087.1 peptide ABC transporter permease [Actinorhabdospora filicis]
MSGTMEPMVTETAGPGVAVMAEIPEAEARKFVGLSPGKLAWRRLKRDKVAFWSFVTVVVMFVVAYGAPLISLLYGKDYTTMNSDLLDAYGRPLGYLNGVSGEHWLGIQIGTGRDVFMQMIYGMRTSMTISFVSAVGAIFFGVVVGIIAGYFGGWIDAIISWFIDFMLSFPFLIFAMAAVPIFANVVVGEAKEVPGWINASFLIMVFLIFGWTGTARLVRGQVIGLREREFVEAARASGAGPMHIIFRQLLPNVWAPILVSFSMAVPAFIAAEAALSFLGIGVLEPTPDLGRLVGQAVATMQLDGMWMYLLVTGGAVFLLVLAFNLFGDALRDALDPKSSR